MSLMNNQHKAVFYAICLIFVFIWTFGSLRVYFNTNSSDSCNIQILRAMMIENRRGERGEFPYSKTNKGSKFYDVVNKIFNGKRNGVFLEAGAFDGIGASNTLGLELLNGWTGVLIEDRPDLFKSVLKTNRKAIMINTCIAPSKQRGTYNMSLPLDPQFPASATLMGELGYPVKNANYTVVPRLCFPFMDILKATNHTKLDFLSLDIQFIELDVMKSMDWNSVDIKVILMEIGANAAISRSQWLDSMNSILEPVGYILQKAYRYDACYMKRNIDIS